MCLCWGKQGRFSVERGSFLSHMVGVPGVLPFSWCFSLCCLQSGLAGFSSRRTSSPGPVLGELHEGLLWPPTLSRIRRPWGQGVDPPEACAHPSRTFCRAQSSSPKRPHVPFSPGVLLVLCPQSSSVPSVKPWQGMQEGMDGWSTDPGLGGPGHEQDPRGCEDRGGLGTRLRA